MNKSPLAKGSPWAGLILGLMMVLTPGLGVPSEEMLQDTLKSAIVSFLGLGAAMLVVGYRTQRKGLVWHWVLWLPVGLMAYASGSMLWSHTYLGGAEAIRWFIFSAILFAGANTDIRTLQHRVPWGVHIGITLASLWVVLQFVGNLQIFPQGPNPASTFVNRNFFAEYAVCALPYSVLLLSRNGNRLTTSVLAATLGLNVVAILMTGTRSALVALAIMMLAMPFILWHFRKFLNMQAWEHLGLVLVTVMTMVVSLGTLPTHNPKVQLEFGAHSTALSRAFTRVESMATPQEYQVGSFSIRARMWMATTRMIRGNPLAGVGAGAWEVQIPLYQDAGTQLETDFYAHNEILQLLAEYGLTGWCFLALLALYLWRSTPWTTDIRTPALRQQLASVRFAALVSLLALMVVSNAGFPWRLASTGALFSLSLGMLCASDVASGNRHQYRRITVNHATRRLVLSLGLISMLTALYITQRAAYAESNLVRGIRMGLVISRAGNPHHEYWDIPKKEMLTLLQRGIAANRHYRKLTAIAADELASMGDWKNALWVWQSVLDSRPHVVAIMVNIARAQMELGDLPQARMMLDQAQAQQPTALAVRSFNVLLLSREGHDAQAIQLAHTLFANQEVDYDLVHTAYQLGVRAQDWPLVIQSLRVRMQHWPHEAVDAWLKLATLYDGQMSVRDEENAIAAYKEAIRLAPPTQRNDVLARIPLRYRNRI